MGCTGDAFQVHYNHEALNYKGDNVPSMFSFRALTESRIRWGLIAGRGKITTRIEDSKDTLAKSSPLLVPDPSPCVFHLITPFKYSLRKTSYCAAKLRAQNSFFFTLESLSKIKTTSETSLTSAIPLAGSRLNHRFPEGISFRKCLI